MQNVVTWVNRLTRWCPIGALSFEAVRFDTQLLQHPDIAGVEYQHGELAGVEVREYLLLKWGYRCAYCHQQATATNRWEIDHILPRSRGGSDRVSNLALVLPCLQPARKATRPLWSLAIPRSRSRRKPP